MVEVLDRSIWHLDRAKVCEVQRGINKNLWIPPPPRQPRREQLQASAIVLSAFGAVALIIGTIMLTPVGPRKHPYLPAPQPYPPSYKEAGGILIGGSVLVGIIASTLAGVSR